MIDIGTTDFYIPAPSLSKRRLEEYSIYLFDSWESNIEKELLLPDYSLALQVEEGSIKGIGSIATVLGALYFGIGSYGSFISGLQTIQKQVSAVGDFLSETATNKLGCSYSDTKVRKRSGALGSLQRLFVKVQSGEITPEEAMKEAEALLGDDAYTSPEFMQKLNQSLEEAPHFHQQIPFPLEESKNKPQKPNKTNRLPRSPSEPARPPQTHFRVEVWRESKSKKKHIRTFKK